MASTEVVVGRIGKAHGIRGEVSVEVRTDEPERRYADGATLATRTPRGEEPHGTGRPHRLTVRGTRWHQSRLLVTFEEIHDRTAAEAARGLLLAVEVADDETPEDPDEFYDHQLIGLTVYDVDGTVLGEVTGLVHGGAQDLLAVKALDGRDTLVPFVKALVPEVDVAGGRVVVADRPGLVAPLPEDHE